MKPILTLSAIFLIAFTAHILTVQCQEEDEEEVEKIEPQNTNPLIPVDRTRINKGINRVRNESVGLLDRIANRIASKLNRAQDRVSSIITRSQERLENHYSRHVERLQSRAVDSLERLRSYIDRRVKSSVGDEADKNAVQKILDNINEMINNLRNLFSSSASPKNAVENLIPKVDTQ